MDVRHDIVELSGHGRQSVDKEEPRKPSTADALPQACLSNTACNSEIGLRIAGTLLERVLFSDFRFLL
jgi:hypothetical protein